MAAGDVTKAEKARADGNASFKKGRWVEAIGHYTTAIVANPDDAIPYTNRAAAYLKLDKYEDAERDSTTALDRQPGHLKALYRRGLARKGLERYEEAMSDLEAILAVEKNEMAASELEEVKDLLREQQDKARRKRQAKARLPPSPPRAPASIEEIPDEDASDASIHATAKPLEDAETAVEESMPGKLDAVSLTDQGIAAPKTKGTFADMRKSRTDRKTYISTATSSSSAPASASRNGPASRSLGGAPAVKSNGTAGSSSETPKLPPVQATAGPLSAQRSKRTAPSPPASPTSTSPSAGFHLLRTIAPLKPDETWAYLLHYPPEVIPKILSSLLEPESLGQILLALRHGVDSDQDRVRAILKGLRGTDRWKINVAMLERAEMQAGREAWEACRCQGTFT